MPTTELVLVLNAYFHISGNGKNFGKSRTTRSTITPRPSPLTLEDLADVLVVVFHRSSSKFSRIWRPSQDSGDLHWVEGTSVRALNT